MMNQGVQQIQSSPMAATPSPRHPGGPDAAVSLGLSPRPLDGDFDEELHADILAPPPPPPPPHRNSKGSNVSSRQERKTMEEQQQQYQQYQQPPPTSHVSESYQQREPLNSLTPDPEQQQTQQYKFQQQHDAPKEHSGCDPNVQRSSNNNDVTKKKKQPRSSSHSRPPIQPGAESAEYGSRIESFHKIMLENIEKETMMIRSQGSFQMHQKNLSNKSKNRSSSGNNNISHGENSENHNGGTKHRRRNSSSRVDASGAVITADNANVGSLLKETMKDISVAAAHTMASLKSALQHTKDRAAGNDLNAVTGPMACGGMDDTATAFGQELNGVDSLDGILDPAKMPRTSSTGRASETPGIANVPMLRTSSGTELMKKMHQMSDAFRKVVVDATATGGDNDQRRDEKDEEENSTSAEAWGLGNVLANGFGWEGAGGGEYEDDDDDRSRATYDTWDEENSVLRRLGSWGTINSQFTAGTVGTAATLGTMATYDTEAGSSIIGPVSVAVAAASAAKVAVEGDGGIVGSDSVPKNGDQLVVPGNHHLRNSADPLHDDDGSLIDPALVEAALKMKKKKKKCRGRRKKVVKFDYPPISSLRQYTRPAPEDLPNLFFTEHELDQIEDDRYSTMSTDDIEIVAVSSKTNPGATSADDGDDAIDAKAKASKKKPVSFASSPKASAEHEPGMKPVKGRSGTPDRRRTCGDFSEKSPSKNSKSPANNKNSGEEAEGPSSPRRLVKGVQIYLRERSTGM